MINFIRVYHNFPRSIQGMFDKVLEGMRLQGRPCIDEQGNVCGRYVTRDGVSLKDPINMIQPDDLYKSDQEGLVVLAPPFHQFHMLVRAACPTDAPEALDLFLLGIQRAHDQSVLDVKFSTVVIGSDAAVRYDVFRLTYEARMLVLANRFGLQYEMPPLPKPAA